MSRENMSSKEKVSEFLNKYSERINNKTKSIFEENSNECFKSNNKYENLTENLTFTRNIVTNYKNLDQKTFNQIFACTISKVKEYLSKSDDIFFHDFLSSLNYSNSNKYYTKYIIELYNIGMAKIYIEEKSTYFPKLLFIFFFFLGVQRGFIFIIQKFNDAIKPNLSISDNNRFFKEITGKYGLLSMKFMINEKYIIKHPILMPRLKNYLGRIIENLIVLQKINDNNIVESNYFKKESYKRYKIYYTEDEVNNKNVYMNIGFPTKKYDFLFKEELTNNEENRAYIYFLGNYSKSIDDRLYFINILCNILKELDSSKNSNNIENKKLKIMKFYYILILLMPFELGTAAIAEMALYSLWEYYIGTRISINKNIMLDVEALTLPFNIFYQNSFQTANPYLEILS